MPHVKPFFFGSFLHAGKNAQSSSSMTSAQPASQSEGIYTISHIPFGAMCRDSMSTQLWCHVLSHHSFRWRNLCLPFFLWNAGKNAQSSSFTIRRYLHHITYSLWSHVWGLYVNTSLLSCFKPLQLEMKAPFSSFFTFEMQLITPSCPRQRHLLSQLHNRKVFTPYHIFLLEPCVGTVCEHKFAIMF